MNTTSGELIQFEASDGLILTGFLAKSKYPNETVVVHVHGFGGNFASFSSLFRIYGRALKQGFSLFTINTRGAGLKTRFRSDNKSFTIGSSNEVFEDCVKDISGAILAVKRLGFERVILSGHSTGCQKVTYYQSLTQNESVKGLILLAPTDDYNANKKDLGVKFDAAASLAKSMVALGMGHQPMPEETGVHFMSAMRFNSVANLENPEANIFNYEAPKLNIYSKVEVPVLAVFGGQEQYRTKPVKQYIQKLYKDGNYRYTLEHINVSTFTGKIVAGAGHGFTGKASTLSKIIGKWIIEGK
ncbi:MAG: alpha/beta fold hydrolase [Nitrososphaerota archaeon]|nr:alpha/beta fold hydrolase [Nitrososphaerota archaeon]